MADGRFPDGFVWGAATAAYQIEGAVDEGGRGPSIWDTFSHTPGAVHGGDTGDVACDHYHRWPEDLQLMRELGLHAYRFSVAWPRVLPRGAGQVNQAGLDFYDRLVDALLEAGITPFVTLYHWDLPQALQDQGGWASRDTAHAFAAYAEAVVRRLGDRVRHWITHNEPWVVAFPGHYEGRHAPGVRDLRTALAVAHNLLLSHGLAVPALRAGSPGAEVGITLNFSPARPASASPEDAEAARRFDDALNHWFLDPVYGRGYPAELARRYGELMPAIAPGDMETIAAPIDFLGVNYYFPAIVRAVPASVEPIGATELTPHELVAAGHTLTAMGWPVVPDALRALLGHLNSRCAPGRIYITENGAAFPDEAVDGTVDDPRRVAYLREHLAAARRAIAEGVPLRGYFVWSLLDNFEWAHGYSKRFGIVYVDYTTLRRIPKASAGWYRRAVAANGAVEG
ncbi:MAG TPA: GH1 family beta-glucosidase [Chloroflexaceae bacterium]|nr:GH1 family beta-glucosidase [Chloroflexaceae bacterium]